MEVVRGLAREKTVLLISHRLANVTVADEIFVLQAGTEGIAEHGTHRELMQRQGYYCRLYEAQQELESYAGTQQKEDGVMKQNKDNQNKKQRSGFAVMCGLIGMIKPLLGIMCLAILMGCAGNLMATFLTILGGYALLTVTGVYSGMRLSVIFTLLVCFAVARGILRYAEQASNHYIAFKLLARIRHQCLIPCADWHRPSWTARKRATRSRLSPAISNFSRCFMHTRSRRSQSRSSHRWLRRSS